MLYGTTKRFLEIFGLASVKDLPPVGEAFPGVDPSKVRAAKPAPEESAPGGGEAAAAIDAAPEQGAAE
ncbi:MAG: SMC-Scp complex subunit ScpB, partial [Planctomycetes bacterium]|nr:SMC-Scp complex subunit ScpB [Planctomycetota bacterium]